MTRTVEYIIKKHFKNLRPSEKKVAEYILNCKEDISELTITQLAKQSKVSQPTIMRFAQRIGINGFKELKYIMVQDRLQDSAYSHPPLYLHGFSITPQEQLKNIPSIVVTEKLKILQDLIDHFSMKDYLRLIDKIVHASNVFIFGCENSYSAIIDLSAKLLFSGIKCVSYPDYQFQRICASNLTKADLAIGISYCGNSNETIEVMKIAYKTGATTAAISHFAKSLISNYADICISASTEQLVNQDVIYSQTSQIAVIDMIYLGILLDRDY